MRKGTRQKNVKKVGTDRRLMSLFSYTATTPRKTRDCNEAVVGRDSISTHFTKTGEPMSGLFATEHELMTTTAGKVDAVNDQVQAELQRLQGTVDGVAGAWKGNASVAFGELMAQWNDAALRLREALSSTSDNIRANASAFATTEEQNAASFTQLGGLSL